MAIIDRRQIVGLYASDFSAAFTREVTSTGQATISGSGSPVIGYSYTGMGQVIISRPAGIILVEVSYTEDISGKVTCLGTNDLQFQYTESVSGGGVCSGTAPPTNSYDYVLSIGGSVTASGIGALAVDYPMLGTAAAVVCSGTAAVVLNLENVAGTVLVSASGSNDFLPEYDCPISRATVVFAGVASIEVTVSETAYYVEAAGGTVSLSGAAQVYQFAYNFAMSGLAAFSASSSLVELHTIEGASGGVITGGHSNEVVDCIYIETSSGTVLVASGTGAVYQLGYIFVTIGGSICLGSVSEIVGWTYVIPPTTDNILVASGTAAAWQSFPNITSSGTVILGGSAPYQAAAEYAYVGTAQVSASGAANRQFIYVELSSGSLAGSGASMVAAEYDYVSAGTAYVDGAAQVIPVFHYLLTIGGSVISSSGALVWAGYNESAAGGSTTSGAAPGIPVYIWVTSGSLVAASSALETATTGFIFSGSGVVICSGNVIPESVDTVTCRGSGGVILSGEASVNVEYHEPVQGLVVSSTVTVWWAEYDFVGRSNVTLLGSAGLQLATKYVAAGGITAGGSADLAFVYDEVSTGFVVASGSAALVATFTLAGSGRVTALASGIVQLHFVYSSIAVGLLSGTAPAQSTSGMTWLASGGVVASGFAVVVTGGSAAISGSAAIQLEYFLLASGRVGAYGQASYTSGYFFDLSIQAVTFSGGAGIAVTVLWLTSGGCVGSGNASITWQLLVPAGGGCVMSGTAAYDCHFSPRSTGRGIVSGSCLSELGYVLGGMVVALLSGMALMRQTGHVIRIESYSPHSDFWQEREDTIQRQAPRDPFWGEK